MNPKKIIVWVGTGIAAAGFAAAQKEVNMDRKPRQKPTLGVLAFAAAIAIAIEFVEYGLERKFLPKD